MFVWTMKESEGMVLENGKTLAVGFPRTNEIQIGKVGNKKIFVLNFST